MNDRYKNIKACVQYSGGLMSFGAAKLTVDKYGAENVILLFADTGVESDGTYRFIVQGAAALGCELVVICAKDENGKKLTPWDIAEKYGFIPDWRAPICSAYLKQKPCQKWIKENLPQDTKIIIGFSVEEERRIQRLQKRDKNKNFAFPLAEKPYTTPCQIRGWLADMGLKESDLYEKVANHANCNGACFQMSKHSFAWLYKTNPELFAEWAKKEKEFISRHPNKQATILRKKGEPYTLEQLRADVDAGLVEPSFNRLPCACGVVFYQEELDFNPADIDDADIDGKEEA